MRITEGSGAPKESPGGRQRTIKERVGYLLGAITGLRAPTAGSVKVAGLDPTTDVIQRHPRISVLCEQAGFYDWTSADDYLRFHDVLLDSFRRSARDAKFSIEYFICCDNM